MDETTVFVKTDQGEREVAHPDAETHPRLRRILVLVDGVKTVAELAPYTREGEIEVILEELLDLGCIAAAGK